MSLKILISPQRYVQGSDALSQIGGQLENFGIKAPLIMASPSAMTVCRETIEASLDAGGIKHAFIEFQRESTMEEIYRIRDACISGGHDALVSCGGGKALDAGRAAAAGFAMKTSPAGIEMLDPLGADIVCVQVPTVAATNAATASLSMFYNEQGVQAGALLMRTNPALVLVDTAILAKAPIHTLVAGMGDAVSIYFEAGVSVQTATPALTGGLATRTGFMMTELTFNILVEYGRDALREIETGEPGTAFEAVIEAIFLSSGIGYESCGLSASHAIAGALTLIHDHYDPIPLHGEMVAFCTLCQIIMEDRDRALLDKVFRFCKGVGLPVTFKDLGLKEVPDDALELVAEDAAKSFIIRSMPDAHENPDNEGRFYDKDKIMRCLRETDARGQAY